MENVGLQHSREEMKNTVRIRVTFPKAAYARLLALAEKMAIPVPELVRIMASLQMVQWENVYMNPERMMANYATLHGGMQESLEELFPEMEESVKKSP